MQRSLDLVQENGCQTEIFVIFLSLSIKISKQCFEAGDIPLSSPFNIPFYAKHSEEQEAS
jgi:hypothetical protein